MLRFVTFLAPNIFPVYHFIARYVGEKLGLETELLAGESHDQFSQLEPDVAFICGLPYVLMMRQNPAPVEILAAPVLQGERYGGRPVYFSDVIVRRDAPFHSFADLRGATWAYNERVSQSGYGVTRHKLIQMGEINGYFGQVINAGWHQRAIEMICDGRVDAAAIDSQVLAVELRQQPTLAAQVKIIDKLGPSTIQPVVVRAGLPESLKQAIRRLLLQMGDDPAARECLDYGLFERFVNMSDSDYDDIRAMLQMAEEMNFLTIR